MKVFALALLTITAVIGQFTYAELVIKLRSGETVTVPIPADQIESISFGGSVSEASQPDLGQAAESEVNRDASVVFRVGPDREYKTPSSVVDLAADGDTIEIDAATYVGDVAVWWQDNLVLRGIGGRPHLQAAGHAAQEKAIWVIEGKNVTVENIEFSGARVADRNGGGIRHDGRGLLIKNSYFHDNEVGLLCRNDPENEIVIEGSEFAFNTVDYDRYKTLGHNIYIGHIGKFTLRDSYIHGAHTGHNVKSRARENYVLYNRISDEEKGSSYLVDLPEGGYAYVIGNVFHQSSHNDNPTIISYAAEANRRFEKQLLTVVNNTAVSEDEAAVFVRNHSVVPARIVNNLLVGADTISSGPTEASNNLYQREASLANVANYDYRLLSGSAAIDRGVEPGASEIGFPLKPRFQYVHPHGSEARPEDATIDIGAYEFTWD